MNGKRVYSFNPARGRRAAFAAAALALVLSAGAARADRWIFSVTPYAWATDVGVDATLGGRQVIDTTIPVSDLLSDLNTIFQGRLEAQHGEFGAMVDLFDVTLTDEVSGLALPQGAGRADLTSDVGMTILDVEGVYDHKGDHQGLAILYGTRVLDERATIDASLNLAAGPTVAQTYEIDDWLVDGLVGARFSQRFGRHWGYQMQADASTGGTDYTWSVGPTLSYAFGKYGQYGVNAGYRHMVVDFEDNGDLNTQMTLTGAVLGFRVSF
jgi:hypothetical protein